MSGFQAIGGVSATLQTLLKDRMEVPGAVDPDDVDVTVGTPAPAPTENGTVAPRVNVFLYRVTENAFLKNQEIPGHGERGNYGHPPLSLDLHYLLTAYGETSDTGDQPNETLAHFLLGSAMRVLHDYPVVTEELRIRRTTPADPMLHASLRGQFEQVKLTFEPLTLDDVSKVWTALNQPYRLSSAYLISVVQIESRHRTSHHRLVGEPPPSGPRVHGETISNPRIDEISVRRPEDPQHVERPYPYARIGDVLTVRGGGFSGEQVRVMLGPVDATAHVTGLREDRVSVVVPDDPRLGCGPHTVEVVLDMMVGDPPEARAGARSNAGVVVVIPRVDEAVRDEASGQPPHWTIHGKRLFEAGKECVTLLDGHVVGSSSYTPAPSESAVGFGRPTGPAPGTYRVRVRVGGVESIDDDDVVLP